MFKRIRNKIYAYSRASGVGREEGEWRGREYGPGCRPWKRINTLCST